MSTSYSSNHAQTDADPEAAIARLEHRVKWLERELLRVHFHATHDELTGVLSRGLFNDRLEQAVMQAKRQCRQVGLLFLDLDGFKQINDRYGHQFGDELLQQVAQRLVGCTRDADTVGRFGGDEFMVLVPEVRGEQGVAILAAKLRKCLAEPYLVDGRSVTLTASIGAAIYPQDSLEQDALIRCADAAMYAAKVGDATMQVLHGMGR